MLASAGPGASPGAGRCLLGHCRSVNNSYFHSTNSFRVISKGVQKELVHQRSLLPIRGVSPFVLTETSSVLELQRRARSLPVGGAGNRCPEQAFLSRCQDPGARLSTEYSIHLISFNPHLPKVWITPFFYRLGNRLRRHEVTCPGTRSCQDTVRRQAPKCLLMHLAWLPPETDGV